MKQVVVTIASKDYTIRLDDDFAQSFNDDMKALLQNRPQFSVKDLLEAFVTKCHESYTQKKQMDALLSNLDKSLN